MVEKHERKTLPGSISSFLEMFPYTQRTDRKALVSLNDHKLVIMFLHNAPVRFSAFVCLATFKTGSVSVANVP